MDLKWMSWAKQLTVVNRKRKSDFIYFQYFI